MLQTGGLRYARGAADAPLVEICKGNLDQNKVFLAYGHNLAAGAEA